MPHLRHCTHKETLSSLIPGDVSATGHFASLVKETECDEMDYLQVRQQHLTAAESQRSQTSDKSSADTDTELPVQTVEHPPPSDDSDHSAMPKVRFCDGP